MVFEINSNSHKKYEDSDGDVMTLDAFIGGCECRGFTDSDGVISAILLNNYVVFDGECSPSDVMENKSYLENKQGSLGVLHVVWHNK
ncbi:hypothetical protein [Bacillus sp. NEAU-Y102]